MDNKRITKINNSTLLDNANYGMGMKYYNFLKVVLVLGAILNIGQSFMYFNGTVYLKNGLEPDMVYSKFPDMKFVDIAFGMIIIALSGFQLYVRNQLKFKTKCAPNLIVTLHAISFVPTMIYNLCAGFIFGDVYSAIPSIVPTLIISPIYAYITYVYFSKRKFIFVN